MRFVKASIYGFILPLLLGILAPAPASATESYSNPISGFFIYSDGNAEKNLAKLDAIKAAGGDTVITFGHRLRPAGQNGAGHITTDGAVNEAFLDCYLDGVPCVTAMKRAHNIRSTFTYGDKSLWDGGALKCGNDRIIQNGQGKKSFTLLVIPTQDNGCASPNGQYDLVVINNSWAGQNATTALVDGAAQRGMSYIIGLPAPVIDPTHGHLPNMSYFETMEKFTDRFMLELASQHNGPGLGGFYHHFEQNLNSAWHETLSLYRMQNRMIAKHFGASKLAVVSPYIDSRKIWTGATPAQAAQNVMAIVDTAEGVPMAIAPQDGVGTGKGAAYYDTEAGAPVDPWSIPESGAGSNAGIHHASTRHYYRAIRDTLGPTGVQLWSNLEGMTASHNGTNICTNGTARGATVKERLDKQVQMAGSYTAKNISFMWDHYYTCAPYGSSLGQELSWRKSDPIVTDAWSEGDNLVVIGYNLNPAKVDVVQGSFSVSGTPVEHISDVGSGRQKVVFSQTAMGITVSGNYLVTVTSSSGKASSLPVDLVAPVRHVPQEAPPSEVVAEVEEAIEDPVEEDPEEKQPKVSRGAGYKLVDDYSVAQKVLPLAEEEEASPLVPDWMAFTGLLAIPGLAVCLKRMFSLRDKASTL